MTESRGRLDPLQSYPAITIPSFLLGNTQGRERKLDKILLKRARVAGERDETEHVPSLPEHLLRKKAFVGFKPSVVFDSEYAKPI